MLFLFSDKAVAPVVREVKKASDLGVVPPILPSPDPGNRLGWTKDWPKAKPLI